MLILLSLPPLLVEILLQRLLLLLSNAFAQLMSLFATSHLLRDTISSQLLLSESGMLTLLSLLPLLVEILQLLPLPQQKLSPRLASAHRLSHFARSSCHRTSHEEKLLQ
jgi:hypothetical protein